MAKSKKIQGRDHVLTNRASALLYAIHPEEETPDWSMYDVHEIVIQHLNGFALLDRSLSDFLIGPIKRTNVSVV